MTTRTLLLVNQNDDVIGTGEKLFVHQEALLHRAFSILIYNSKGEMLIQRRSIEKYHSGGLWTNACCSHPIVEQTHEDTLHDRLREEIGLDCELDFKFKFIYKALFDNGLTEHELDYVYTGQTDQEPTLNPEEADAYKWIAINELLTAIDEQPETFTVWFKIIIQRMYEKKLA